MKDVYLGFIFHSNIANFCNVNYKLPKHYKGGEVASVPQEIAAIENERLSHLSCDITTNNDRPVNFVHYKASPDPPKQKVEHYAVEKMTTKSWRRTREEKFNYLPKSGTTNRQLREYSNILRAYETDI